MSTRTRTRPRESANGTPRRTSTQLQARMSNAGIPTSKDGSPHSQIMLITPDLAEEWLSRNTHNRRLYQAEVDKLAGILQRGEWRLNGESIDFDCNGTLIDGQHRLWAIFTSGVAAESVVVTGLDPQAQETIDNGKRRNLKDVLELRGHPDAGKTAAVLNYKWRYDNGKVRVAAARPTTHQALALLEVSPGLDESIKQAERINRRFRGSVGMLATALYEFSSIDTEDCDVFVEKLVAGVGLEEADPILALRRNLERQSVSSVGTRASAVVTHALFIKAWNAWRDGRQVETLTWKASGLRAEAFPEPH